jgi:molybdenum cofactor cytidylyltransferase
MTRERVVCGLVLAAGGSSRLGRPKQLLPFGEGTLLDAVLSTARSCPFHQRVVALGGSASEIRAAVDLAGFDVVVNESFGEGCSSSIAAALSVVGPECGLLVLMLGDQPGVTREAVRALLDGRGGAPIAVCAYSDGRGHPFAFSRSVFGELSDLHGDKAVWKLIEGRAGDVVEVPVEGPVPRDVDTWKDYDAVLAAAER